MNLTATNKALGDPATVPARRDNKKRKLDDPKVAAAILHWLFDEKISYQAARARLQEQFGISASNSSLCGFWQRHVKPAKPAAESVITIQLTIRASGPVQVQVEQRDSNS